jgi:hypothetical protein
MQARAIALYVMDYVYSIVSSTDSFFPAQNVDKCATSTTIILFRHVSDRANTSVELVRTDTCSLWNYEPSEGHRESTRGRH